MVGSIGYARSDEAYVAYQVVGGGPRDLLVVMDGFIPIDTMDDEPRLARGMTRLSSFARLIRFDRRGIGLSDPVAPTSPPTLEQWVADALAVLDAAESNQSVVLAATEASPIALMLAAAHPDRVSGLVIVNGFARAMVDVDYPFGMSAEAVEEILGSTDPVPSDPSVDWTAEFAPSAANDPQFRQWWEQTGRRGASPATARALLKVALESDVRPVLSTIRVPTLVTQFRQHQTILAGRYIADHVPGATYVEVDGADDYWWAADGADQALDEIEEFVTGVRGSSRFDRVLSTVLFTDIVASTTRASELGDHRWRALLDRHDAAVRRQIARFRGREVNTTGDGFLATFDGPARAVECACAIRDVALQLDLPVRCGVHTGEVEIRGDDIGGIAVHIGARVAAVAGANQVLVSRTVVDLVVGSGINFEDLGEHELKGVPGRWNLYQVAPN